MYLSLQETLYQRCKWLFFVHLNSISLFGDWSSLSGWPLLIGAPAGEISILKCFNNPRKLSTRKQNYHDFYHDEFLCHKQNASPRSFISTCPIIRDWSLLVNIYTAC